MSKRQMPSNPENKRQSISPIALNSKKKAADQKNLSTRRISTANGNFLYQSTQNPFSKKPNKQQNTQKMQRLQYPYAQFEYPRNLKTEREVNYVVTKKPQRMTKKSRTPIKNQATQSKNQTINFQKNQYPNLDPKARLNSTTVVYSKVKDKPILIQSKDVRRIRLIVKLVTNQDLKLIIQENKTGYDLKQKIFENSTSPQVNQMFLFFNEVELRNQTLIQEMRFDYAEYNIIVQTTNSLSFSSKIQKLKQEKNRFQLLASKLSSLQNMTQMNRQPKSGKPKEQIIKSIPLAVKFINNQERKLQIKEDKTGYHLKQKIFELSNILQVKRMSLFFNQAEITDSILLSELKFDQKQNTIEQRKVDLCFVSKIKVLDQMDVVSLERYVAEMSCGHKIGSNSMIQLVKCAIQSGNYAIFCPHFENGSKCGKQWDIQQCRRVGIFTSKERQLFQKGLSEQYIKLMCKLCPQCKNPIQKGALQTNRVRCPFCDSHDFCFLCLNPWQGGADCGNEDCLFKTNFLQNSQWTKKFSLIDVGDNGSRKQYLTPEYRSCVHCSFMITHSDGCKHMTCISCSKKFCWVCLAVQDQKGAWPCKAFNQFCGTIAPAQKRAI